MKKTLLLICDGLGDRPIPELDGKTPLEAAFTPNLDRIAKQAIKGMMTTLGIGIAPGSAVAHLAIFGYDPETYYSGRGCIEVAGLGMELKPGDVAFRGNFGTVDENLNVTDRRAGRIETVEPLASALDGMEIDDVRFTIKAGIAHRAGVIMSGPGLSNAISDADPHHLNVRAGMVKPLDDTPEAKRTADILNRFLDKAHEILNTHEYNQQRRQQGKLPGNYLLLRGAGKYMSVPSFQDRYGLDAVCITGGGLYRGVGNYLGMKIVDVAGANGTKNSDLDAKLAMAKTCLEQSDFVFVHVKATDNAGHDGNYQEKRDMIEKVDRALTQLDKLEQSALVIVTGDHSTPCGLQEHSADPVPIMFAGPWVRPDGIDMFNERACMRGGLGTIRGMDVLPITLGLLGKTPVVGA